jgi:cell shape-determining protein MreC
VSFLYTLSAWQLSAQLQAATGTPFLEYGVLGICLAVILALLKFISDLIGRHDTQIAQLNKEHREALERIATDYKAAIDKLTDGLKGQTDAITKNTTVMEQVATLSKLQEFISRRVGNQ